MSETSRSPSVISSLRFQSFLFLSLGVIDTDITVYQKNLYETLVRFENILSLILYFIIMGNMRNILRLLLTYKTIVLVKMDRRGRLIGSNYCVSNYSVSRMKIPHPQGVCPALR